MKPYDHPLRQVLHEEVHSRPPVAQWPKERILSQAFLLDAESRQLQIDWIECLSKAFQSKGNTSQDHFFRSIELSAAPERIIIKWELHGEFATIAAIVQQSAPVDKPLIQTRHAILDRLNAVLQKMACPSIEAAGGQRITAIDIAFEDRSLFNDAEEVAAIFNGNTLLGSYIMSNRRAQLWTDLNLNEDGFISYYVPHNTLGSRQAGRVARRITEIETYRMAAMLAFPVAKGLSLPLRNAESDLAQMSKEIALLQTDSGSQLKKNGEFLSELSQLASKTEQWISEYGLRFTAAEAYSQLVNKNLAELNEEPIPGVQTLVEFMDRRFQPAMGTCLWTQRRLKELSDRVSRTTQTLRTRIEFVNEEQTQALLASMDKRAKLQLRMQETVDSLSVLVLTYYLVGLLFYVAKGGKEAGLAIYPEIVAAIAAPIVAAIFFVISKRRRAQNARNAISS
jgi:uncharacterized membrane-anchored protein